MTGFDLEGVDLSGASLCGTILNNANLVGAKLCSANITSANLAGANLTLADMANATVTDACLQKCKLEGAVLTNVQGPTSDMLRSAGSIRRVDLSGLPLLDDNLTGMDLAGANLAGANIAGARLSKANLTRTNLAGAKFINPIQLDGVIGLESFPKGSVDILSHQLGTVVILAGWLTYTTTRADKETDARVRLVNGGESRGVKPDVFRVPA